MLMMAWTAIQMMWNKTTTYVIIGFAIIGAFFATYLRGRRDANNEVQRRVLGQDLENRRVGETIRGRVDSVDDPSDGLRRWTRDGR